MTEQEATATLPLATSSATVGEISFPHVTQAQMAWQDIKEGLQKWPIWLTLAYQDIKVRYRRSVLGPFWLTLSMAITVYSMGFLYAHLFHSELRQYYPFLVAGMVSWGLIAAGISELTDTFAGAESLRLIKMPYSLYIHRTISRNIIIFFHNMLVMIPIYIIFHEVVKINLHTLLLIPGLIITYVNAMIYGLILAMIGARFRDISQIIKSLIQVIFFVTPIMWDPNVLPAKDRILVIGNPFYSYIELIRAPLLGMAPTLTNWCITFLTTLVGGFICMRMFSRYRSRIIYWL